MMRGVVSPEFVHSPLLAGLQRGVLLTAAILLTSERVWAACPSVPAPNQVIVYEDSDRQGNCAVLNIGTFLGPPFGSGANIVNNDRISSITLGSGVSADLFQHSQCLGQVYHYENGPFTFNLAGWANDDVSSIRVFARANPQLPPDSRLSLPFAAAATNSASNEQTPTFDLGTMKAGTTIRLGTCSAGGDLPAATATGDTFLRLFLNGFEEALDDDGCTGSRASYMSFTVPFTGNVTVKAGCFLSGSCSGTLEVAFGLPDSNGSVSDVAAAFNAIVGDGPNRNKLNFSQNSIVVGAYRNGVFNEPHFQGLQRIPRTLASTTDTAPRFVLSGSDNADLYTVNFSQPAPGPFGLVGPVPNTPASGTAVIGVESNGSYYDSNGRGHLGGLQASGRWLSGGVEKGGGSGPSTIRFWDLSTLPNPVHVREMDNPMGSAGGIALTKLPGKNQGFLMFVNGLSVDTAQVWTLSGQFGYADLVSGTWVKGAPVTIPPMVTPSPFPGQQPTKLGFQNLSFVNQDDGQLFLVGTVGDGSTNPEGGVDTAVLFKVTGNASNGFSVQKIASKVFVCNFDSSRQCGFNGASGMFIDADQNALRLYSGKAFRPDDPNASMTFVEYF